MRYSYGSGGYGRERTFEQEEADMKLGERFSDEELGHDRYRRYPERCPHGCWWGMCSIRGCR